MKYVKDILQMVGVLILGLCLFYSFNFMTKGSLPSSIGFTLVGLIIFYGLAYILERLKKTETNQSSMKIVEYILLIGGYGFLFLASLVIINHFWSIEFTHKETIKSNGLKKLESFSMMSDSCDSHIKKVCIACEIQMDNDIGYYNTNGDKDYIKAYGFNMGSDNLRAQKDTIIRKIKNNFLGKLENYNERIKDAYIRPSKSAFRNWNILTVPKLYFQIEKKQGEHRKALETISAKDDYGNCSFKAYSSNIKSERGINPSDPLKFFNFSNILIPFFLALIINGLILWPYFFASRAGSKIHRDSGAKTGIEWD